MVHSLGLQLRVLIRVSSAWEVLLRPSYGDMIHQHLSPEADDIRPQPTQIDGTLVV